MEIAVNSIDKFNPTKAINSISQRQYRFDLIVIAALLLFLLSQSASAAEFRKVIKPYFNYAVTADDNLLRFRDNLASNPNLGDFITDPRVLELIRQGKFADVSNRFTGGLMFEKEMARQRFSADFNWAYTKYERFTNIDNNVKSGMGKWNWFLGNRLEGNMGATYAESLMPFVFQPGLRIIRTEQTQFFNGAWRFHPSWRLVGEYMHYSLDTGRSPRATNLNRSEHRFEGGIEYITPSNNTVGVIFRNILGDFSNPVLDPRTGEIFIENGRPFDNGYDQKEVLATANWFFSAKSRIQASAGWVDRQNKSGKDRDFSGFNGRVTYHWQPTAKLGLTINGWRLTSSMNNLTANFGINTGVSAIPSWNITEKVRLEGEFSYETRKFDRFSDITDPTFLLGRKNTLRNATLKLVYTPYLGLQLSTSIYHSDLNSEAFINQSGAVINPGDFNANGVIAGLQYIYGQRR